MLGSDFPMLDSPHRAPMRGEIWGIGLPNCEQGACDLDAFGAFVGCS